MKKMMVLLAIFITSEVFAYFLCSFNAEGDPNRFESTIFEYMWVPFLLNVLLALIVLVILPGIVYLKQLFRDFERTRLTKLLQQGAISASEFDERTRDLR